MTDIVNRLNKLASEYLVSSANTEIESLRQQLDECQAREKVLRDALGVAEYALSNRTSNQSFALNTCVEALAMPSDSTALNTMLKQAKQEGWMNGLASAQAETDTLKKQWQREALLEAKHSLAYMYKEPELVYSDVIEEMLTRMAKELET